MAIVRHKFLYWLALLPFLFFSCSDNDEPTPQLADESLVEATPLGTWAAENLRLLVQLSGRNFDLDLVAYNVAVYKVIYKTSYKDEEVNASGLIFLPQATSASPMISFHRGTTVEQADAPSVQAFDSEDVLSYSALASTGLITVVPDMIGLGESQDIFHPYYVEEPTKDAVIDMLLAARELAADQEIGFDGRLFLAGYSQGGYITMAAHKALETEPVDGFEVIASFPGAGGYDLPGLLNAIRPAATYPDPYYLAYIGMSYQSYYEEPDLITSFFNEPYASKIPDLFNGINTGSQINNQLTESIPDLVRPESISGDETDPANQFLEDRFAENSPIDWVPSVPVFLYHGDADMVVPVQNSEQTYERLLANGTDPQHVELIIFPGHSHGSAIEPYIEDVVKKLQELR